MKGIVTLKKSAVIAAVCMAVLGDGKKKSGVASAGVDD